MRHLALLASLTFFGTTAPVAIAQTAPSASPSAGHRTRPCTSDATVTQYAEPKYDDVARSANRKGSVVVKVSIDPSGHIVKTDLLESSSNTHIDAAAMDAARHTTYYPTLVDCRPMAGTYAFRVDYDFSGCYRDATMVSAARPNIYPQGSRAALILITINRDGSVKNASVAESSGDFEFDQEGLRVARTSKYSPKYLNCVPVEGTYSFRARFDRSG